MGDAVEKDVTEDVKRIARESEQGQMLVAVGISDAIQKMRQARSEKRDREEDVRQARTIEDRQREAVTEMLSAILIAAKHELGDDFKWDTIKLNVEHAKKPA